MKKNVLIYFMLTLLLLTFSMSCLITPSQAEYSPVAIQELTVSPRSSPIQNFIQNHEVNVILITQRFPPCQEYNVKQEYIVCNNDINNCMQKIDNNDINNYMQKIDNLVNPQQIIRIGRVIKTLYYNQFIPFTTFFGMIYNNEVLLQNNRLNYITYTA